MGWDELRKLVRNMVSIGCMCSEGDECGIHDKATLALLIIDNMELKGAAR